MLSPPDHPVERAETLDALLNSCGVGRQSDAALKANFGKPEMSLQVEFAVDLGDVVSNNRSFAMRSDSGFEFFIGGTTKNVETEIVPHDPTQEPGIGAAAILRMFSWIVCRGLNGRPWRN